MSIQQQSNIDDSFNPLLEEIKSSEYSVDKSDSLNPDVALLSVKRRSNSDPRYNKFDITAGVPDVTHAHFATGLVPILGDEVAHGMQRHYHGPRKTTLEQAHGSKLLAVFLLCTISLGVGVFVLPGVFLFYSLVLVLEL